MWGRLCIDTDTTGELYFGDSGFEVTISGVEGIYPSDTLVIGARFEGASGAVEGATLFCKMAMGQKGYLKNPIGNSKTKTKTCGPQGWGFLFESLVRRLASNCPIMNRTITVMR